MYSLKKHFLGLERSVAREVAEFLLKQNSNPALVDLSHILVIVPSAESGRRLKEDLALLLNNENNSALLLPIITTPARLWQICFDDDTTKLAKEPFILNAWIETLKNFDKNKLKDLFLDFEEYAKNTRWLIKVAQSIQSIRIELANGGKSIEEVVQVIPKEYGGYGTDETRWKLLKELENHYLKLVKQKNLYDPPKIMLEMANKPGLPEGIKKIVFAAVPDPVPLAIKIVDKLLEKVEVDILIYASPELEHSFDEWGRPKQEVWNTNCHIMPTIEEENIICVERPIDAAQKIIDLLNKQQKGIDYNAIAFGVPDRELIPFLTDKLSEQGIVAFDPADKPLFRSIPGQLAIDLLDFLTEQSIESFDKLIRNIFIIKWIKKSFATNPQIIISLLDDIREHHLPIDLKALRELLKHHSVECKCTKTCHKDDKENEKENSQVLQAFLNETSNWLSACKNENFIERYRGILADIFKAWDANFTANDEKAIEEIIDILDSLEKLNLKNKEEEMLLLEILLKQKTFEPAPPPEAKEKIKDLYGWLELGWIEEPILIIGGMNEGIVPESITAHPFLPGSLRKELGLQNNDTRFARDAYMLYAIVESRKKGKVIFITPRISQNTEPRMPSRLLCIEQNSEKFVRKLTKFFKPSSIVKQNPPITLDFKLSMDRMDIKAIEDKLAKKTDFSVSELDHYLKSPFLYFLQYVMKGKLGEYEKIELESKDFGTIIHEVLKKLKETTNSKSIEQEFLQHFTSFYGKDELLSFPLLYQKESAIEMIKKVCGLQQEFSEGGWKIKDTEMKITLPLTDNQTVIGSIDRLDYNENKNVLRIIDYKVVSSSDSKKNPFNKHLIKSKSTAQKQALYKYTLDGYKWISLQLPLYVQAVGGMLKNGEILPELDSNKRNNIKIEASHIVISPDITAIDLIPWQCDNKNFETEKDRKDKEDTIPQKILDAAKDSANQIIENIKQHKFLPLDDDDVDDEDAFLNRILPPILLETLDKEELFEEQFLKWLKGE